jgi:hypothetical protein
MKVSLDLADVTAELGNKGVVFYVAANDGKHAGKVRIGRATVEWCKGRKRIGNGKKISMERFLELLEGA